MGDDTISNSYREKIERDLDDLLIDLKRKNESNKPKDGMRSKKDLLIDIAINIFGGALGGLIG